jgi:hypothetical protein
LQVIVLDVSYLAYSYVARGRGLGWVPSGMGLGFVPSGRGLEFVPCGRGLGSVPSGRWRRGGCLGPVYLRLK